MKFDTKSIFIPHISSCGVLQKDLELDGSLPEDKPDISRLISVDAKIGRISVKSENGKTEVTAETVFGILYESDYRAKASYTTISTDFVQKADVDCGKEFYPDADVKCMFLSCKLLGPRRFVIRARMATRFECDTIEEVRTVDTDSSKVSAFFKSYTLSLTAPCRTFADERHFEESVASEKEISSIVCVSCDSLSSEYSASENRLSVKTPVKVKALCEGEDGSYFVCSSTVKTLMTAEDTDIDETKKFRVKFIPSTPLATVESDDYGEQKVVRFSFDGTMEAVCYETVTEEAASDAFCEDRAVECVSGEVKTQSIGEIYEKPFTVEKTFDTEKTDIIRIIDTSVSFRISETSVSDSNAKVKGVYTANIITETQSGMNETTFDGEFEELMPVSEAGICHSEVTLNDVTSSVYGGENITLRASALIRVFGIGEKSESVLTSVSASDIPESVSNEGIRFYYPEKNETLWDIAKIYRMDPKRLGENNNSVFTPDGRLEETCVFVAIE